MKKNKIYRFFKCLYAFFNYWGTSNWHQGIDRPNIWERIYKWRISPDTAWTLATGIWLDRFLKPEGGKEK